MKGMKNMKKIYFRIIVSCVVLLGIFLTAGAMATELSVLERVNTVEDRELGELIRITLENLPETKALIRVSKKYKIASDKARASRSNAYRESLSILSKDIRELGKAEEKKRPEAIKKVTEIYSQIKLLDTQIEQAKNKIDRLTKTDAIFTELTLVIAELETKQNTQFAELRQIMNIVPKYAFSHKAANMLNGWLELGVIGNEIYIFKCLRPYKEIDTIREYPRYSRDSESKLVKRMSKIEAVKYIDNYIKDKNKHPFRLDVMTDTAGKELSQKLYSDIVTSIKSKKLERESVVYLHSNMSTTYTNSLFFRNGKLFKKDYRGSIYPYPGDEEGYIESYTMQLNNPKYLPLVLTYGFNEEGEKLADRISKAVLLKAKEMGIEKLVETRKVLYVHIHVVQTRTGRIVSVGLKNIESNTIDSTFDSFIKDLLPKQLKKAADIPTKLYLTSNDSTTLKEIRRIIRAAVEDASLQDMVEIE